MVQEAYTILDPDPPPPELPKPDTTVKFAIPDVKPGRPQTVSPIKSSRVVLPSEDDIPWGLIWALLIGIVIIPSLFILLFP